VIVEREARHVAEQALRELEARSGRRMAIFDGEFGVPGIVDHGDVWIVNWNTAEYLQSGNVFDQFLAGPIAVPKNGDEFVVLGTAGTTDQELDRWRAQRSRPIAKRSESVQRRVGNVGGANYDGGHLVGNAFGGGPEVVNLVPQLADSNRGVGPGDTFHALETRLRGLLKQDPPASISLHMYPEYGSGGRVPSIITVDFAIDGLVQRKEFDNV
jgi:hypothetical protein